MGGGRGQREGWEYGDKEGVLGKSTGGRQGEEAGGRGRAGEEGEAEGGMRGGG